MPALWSRGTCAVTADDPRTPCPLRMGMPSLRTRMAGPPQGRRSRAPLITPYRFLTARSLLQPSYARSHLNCPVSIQGGTVLSSSPVRHIRCPNCESHKAVEAATHNGALMCFCPQCEHAWNCPDDGTQAVSFRLYRSQGATNAETRSVLNIAKDQPASSVTPCPPDWLVSR
jgi:hypothetical protein